MLQRFASEAASKARHEQAEYRDAVARASSAAEERYQVEMRRERDAHRHAVAKCSAGTEIAVKTKRDIALHARENQLQRERMLAWNEAEWHDCVQ